MITGTKNNAFLTRANIFEALALFNGKTKQDALFYQHKWGSNVINFGDELKFASMFECRLQIWKLIHKKDLTYGQRLFGNGGKNDDENSGKNMLNLTVDESWSLSSEQICTTDHTCLVTNQKILNFFECVEPECRFVAHTEKNLQKHNNAHNIDRVHCTQTMMGPEDLTLNELKNDGLLEPSFRETCGLFWDIESILVKSEKGLSHVPISIAATRNFGNQKEYFFCREDMGPKSLHDVIVDFVDLLEMSYQDYIKTLPKQLWINRKILYDFIKDHRDNKKTLAPAVINKYQRYVDKLNEIICLKIFTYYGERYDIPCLKGALFNEIYKRDSKFTCLKRGSGIMQFRFKNIISRDIGRGRK